MPKMKTHSGAKKRFKVTGSGKVKYMRTNKSHRLIQKGHKKARQTRNSAYASSADQKNLRELIPYK